MIFITPDDLRAIIHDEIGDTPRCELGLEGWGKETEAVLCKIEYGEGDAVDVNELEGLENRIMKAVMQHNDPVF
jgi:hypothetical protein